MASDAPLPDRGDITLGYYDDTDAAYTITQGDVIHQLTLDVAGRRATDNTTHGSTRESLVRHYTDASDNPAWSAQTDNGKGITSRYASGIVGDLGLTFTSTGGDAPVVQATLAGPRGHISATITIPASGTAEGIDEWNDYTEYGASTTAGAFGTGSASGIGYGWHGADERSTTDTGLVLMGARLYVSATALFTSPDPMYGGNSTTYVHPQDPVNAADTTGQFGTGECISTRCQRREARYTRWATGVSTAIYRDPGGWYRRHRDHLAIIGGLAAVASPICWVCGGVSLGLSGVDAAYSWRHRHEQGEGTNLAWDVAAMIPVGDVLRFEGYGTRVARASRVTRAGRRLHLRKAHAARPAPHPRLCGSRATHRQRQCGWTWAGSALAGPMTGFDVVPPWLPLEVRPLSLRGVPGVLRGGLPRDDSDEVGSLLSLDLAEPDDVGEASRLWLVLAGIHYLLPLILVSCLIPSGWTVANDVALFAMGGAFGPPLTLIGLRHALASSGGVLRFGRLADAAMIVSFIAAGLFCLTL